jgi:hypothetical protein
LCQNGKGTMVSKENLAKFWGCWVVVCLHFYCHVGEFFERILWGEQNAYINTQWIFNESWKR